MNQTLIEVLSELIHLRNAIEQQRGAVEKAIVQVLDRLPVSDVNPFPPPPANTADKLFHPKEAAAYLGVSTSTLDKARKADLIKATKLYPSYKGHRYTYQQIQDYIALCQKMEADEKDSIRRAIEKRRS